MARTILHIDMNSFYANCEVVNSGGLYTFDTPLIVTGDPSKRHGIVLAATYAAKRFGVYTTMTIHEALRQCPQAVCVMARHRLYAAYSDKFIDILSSFSPLVERYGLDEAYLDYTGCEHLFGTPEQAAQSIRERVGRELGLTVSIGIGPSKLLAKMGSDYKKPDAVTVMDDAFFRANVWPQSVRKLMFVGRQAEPRLKALGICTIEDLAHAPIALLRQEFGLFGEQMAQYANGVDDSTVEVEHEQAKGVGNSTTLPADATNLQQIDAVLLSLVEQVAYRLRKIGAKAGTVNVSLKNAALKTVGKQKRLSEPSDLTNELYAQARALVRSLWKGERIRLVGIRATQLCYGDEEQETLFFDEKKSKARRLDRCVDSLKDRFGESAVLRGTLLAHDLCENEPIHDHERKGGK